MNNILRKIYNATLNKIFPNTHQIIINTLHREVRGCKRILDLGCGPSSPVKYLKSYPDLDFESVGVDIFSPYILKNLENEKIHSKYINSNILDIDFEDKSFDVALLLDVIEHFEKNDFLKFLPKLEKISNKIVVITPNGFVPQDDYDNNPFQTHKSGWTVDDMKSLGFRCFGLSGWKKLRGEKWEIKIKPVWLGNFIANLSQSLVYKRPKHAYHLICIKENK